LIYFKKRIPIGALIIFSIFAPLFAFSFLDLTLLNRKSYIGIARERAREVNIDLPAKIDLLYKGFSPIFSPAELRNYFIGTKFYPIGTLPKTDTYFCNEGYGLISYKTDRFGLRNNDSKWDSIAEEAITFFVGDGFVLGACVDSQSTLSELFSASTNKNVINLGTTGNDPYSYIAVLKSIVRPITNNFKTKSKNVVLFFYEDDNVPTNQRIESHLDSIYPILEFKIDKSVTPLSEYLDVMSQVIKSNFPTTKEKIRETLREKRDHLRLPFGIIKGNFAYRLLSLYPIRYRLTKIFNALPNQKKEQTFTQLEDKNLPSIKAAQVLHETCSKELECSPYIAYIPHSNYWRPNALSNNYKSQLREIADSLSIRFIDGSIVINQNDYRDYSPLGAHLSKEGYRKFAMLLEREMNHN
tara:strand:- start:143 stop:1378 length:1236 start_codon:yes stop_codon:yes gene_type:complete